MKKFISIFLCFVLVLSLCACGNKTENPTGNDTNPTVQDTKPSTTPSEDPTDSTDKPEETNPDVTTPSETVPGTTDDPIVDDNYIKLGQFKDPNELYAPFNGKIEKLIPNAKFFTFYADGGIYHIEEDDIGQDVMHKFDIGAVDNIIFYYNQIMTLVGNITAEICVYTKPGDDCAYVSITDDSDDYTYSSALTMKVDCDADDILFAIRDSDEVIVIYKSEGTVACLQYDMKAGKLIGSGVIKGIKEDDSVIDLKMLCSDGNKAYAIDENGTCRLVERSFGDIVDEKNGEYFVRMYEKYSFDNAMSLVTCEYDSLFYMANDENNIHSWRFVSGEEPHNVKARLPEGLTINNIKKTWGTDECMVILFDDGQYYVIEEISSFETDEFVDMIKLDFNPDAYQVVGFCCEGFDLVVLLNDGNIYICEDVL